MRPSPHAAHGVQQTPTATSKQASARVPPTQEPLSLARASSALEASTVLEALTVLEASLAWGLALASTLPRWVVASEPKLQVRAQAAGSRQRAIAAAESGDAPSQQDRPAAPHHTPHNGGRQTDSSCRIGGTS